MNTPHLLAAWLLDSCFDFRSGTIFKWISFHKNIFKLEVVLPIAVDDFLNETSLNRAIPMG